MPYNPKTGDHPEAVIKILLTVIEKTPSGGATLDDLKAAYREVKDREPSDKTISRIIKRINLLFDPLAYGEAKEENEPEDNTETGSRAISVQKRNGRVTYIFTKNLEKDKSPLDPGLAFLLALSLYPQQRNMLPGQFEAMMKIIFEDILRKVIDCYRLQNEIERYVFVSGYAPARPAENLRNIENILSALRRKKRVEITYRRAYDGEVTRREVEPYGLLCRHNVWYLAGKCFEKNEQCVFRLDHIRRLDTVENSVVSIPPDFSLKETYGQTWGVWTEGEPSVTLLNHL